MKLRGGWPRASAVALVSAVVVYLFIAALLGGLDRDGPTERIVALLLAATLFGGATLIALGPARSGAGVIAVALVAWIGWDVVMAPARHGTPWGWWAVLALAAALGSREKE